eukprot:CAMPEP_0194681898 /NCGR_PEP_ID=MMETSP0295-20121207/12404_1 /TAXON_ID=39354 /ORGANISM="Heterosigma akashiwo, Strain CCMP2393" /LENGTH=55 /DNA_ID=CAMNT_0039568065 /DNA_START=267 /DNA_END=431 /DNA_ORIENTATION=+
MKHVSGSAFASSPWPHSHLTACPVLAPPLPGRGGAGPGPPQAAHPAPAAGGAAAR